MTDPNDVLDTGEGGAESGSGGGTTGGNPPAPPETAQEIEAALDELATDEERDQDERTVPLRELLRMRKRAQEAEAQLAGMQERIDELERVLAEARSAVDAIERRQQIDLALLEADTVDLESARLLTELALSQADERDVASIVSELRDRKPFLFNSAPARTGSAMGATPRRTPDRLTDAARDAARTGDRRALLRYLQIRRGA